MDNSPKTRKRLAEQPGGGAIGAMEHRSILDNESASRVRLHKWRLAHEATGGHRKNLIAAAIRRLQYKRDEAKGNG